MKRMSKKEEREAENQILKRVVEIATESKDTRAVLSAADMYWKFKGKYPKQESKIIGLYEKVGELQKKDKKKNDRPRDITEENKLPSTPGTAGSPEVQ